MTRFDGRASFPGVFDATGVGYQLCVRTRGGGQLERGEKRDGGRETYSIRLDTMLDTPNDARHHRLEVALVLVVAESQHLPCLPMRIPHYFNHAIVVLFLRRLPTAREREEKEGSAFGVRAEVADHNQRTSPTSHHPPPSCRNNASPRARGSS